ncbi:MAG: PmeII family type II restriction endonuclease [Bacteroidota bacterium]|nr:PmeII family type II restriction endonuclease [Bacteroidota bacterium]
MTEQQLEEHIELIAYLCKKIKGISKNTAGAIGVHFSSLSKFQTSDEEAFLDMRKADKSLLLKPEQISLIIRIKQTYLPRNIQDVREAWTMVLIRDFVNKAIEEIENATLDNLLINPFLIKAFAFQDHQEVVNFYFYQKVTRSIVTSWGFVVQHLLYHSGADGESEAMGFDLAKKVGDKQYEFQIKSSPNTMGIEQVRQLNVHIDRLKKISSSIPMLGMTYGRREQISNQISSTLLGYPESTLIGRELWDFFAEEIGYCKKMLDWISSVMTNEPAKFSEILEKKRLLLINVWEQKYGIGLPSIEKILENYI